jgi:hypothetical protein
MMAILAKTYCDFKNFYILKSDQVFAHRTVNWSQLSEKCNRMLQYNIICKILQQIFIMYLDILLYFTSIVQILLDFVRLH